MILSDGALVKTTTLWSGDTSTFPGFDKIGLTGNQFASYSEMYRRQVWVRVTVEKLAWMTARLPLKTYERNDQDRPEVRDHPYAQLLRVPNPRHPFVWFWLWVSSTYDIFGEAFLGKVRDAGGRPVQLLPLHPTGMHLEEIDADGEQVWTFQNGRVRVEGIRGSDLVHPRNYNPDNISRGLSKLESLRRTLEFEDAAQRAQSSFWSKGARPGTALKHKGNISQPAADRLKLQWDKIAGGADNFGVTVVLEEGMEPEQITLSAEEAQYIGSRKLNREEVVATYDLPPPAVQLLDHATFSNITAQFRSIYRDTQAPRLKLFEGFLETDLRASVRPGADEPDFGDDVYAEFLLDEVLRGDFEQRAAAYRMADYMTVAEKRQRENLPFIEGTDRIIINAASIPLDEIDQGPAMVRAVDTAKTVSTLMGRLARAKSLDEVDGDRLVEGLNGQGAVVLEQLAEARAADLSVPEFRERLKALEVTP